MKWIVSRQESIPNDEKKKSSKYTKNYRHKNQINCINILRPNFCTSGPANGAQEKHHVRVNHHEMGFFISNFGTFTNFNLFISKTICL